MTTPTKVRRFDAADYLNTPSDIAHYLQAALDEKNSAFFLVAPGTAARAYGMSSIATKTNLGRESLYEALTADGNPHFKTVLCVLRSLGVRLSVTPEPPPARRVRRAG
jgi:probable addiction module antidote protein